MEDNFRDEFCDELILHMSKGFSKESFSVILDEKFKIHHPKNAMRHWEKTYPQFEEAIEFGKSKQLLFYEGLLISKATGMLPSNLETLGSTGISFSEIKFALTTLCPEVWGNGQKEEIRKDMEDEIKSFRRKELSTFSNEELREMILEQKERMY